MYCARLISLNEQAQSHAHGHHQLVLALQGRAEFEVEGCGGEVTPLRACLVPGFAAHQFAGTARNRMLIVDLSDQDLAPEEQELLQRLFARPRYPQLDADFQRLLGYAAGELQRFAGDVDLVRGLTVLLLRALWLRQGEVAAVGRSGALNWTRLEAYIEAHLARKVSVAELAAVACLSPSQFHARFKEESGQTPHQYLLQRRLERAGQLLQEGCLPVVRIAEDCGFSSQSALSTALRKYCGMTPKGLRHNLH